MEDILAIPQDLPPRRPLRLVLMMSVALICVAVMSSVRLNLG